jgi:hypothetical protein
MIFSWDGCHRREHRGGETRHLLAPIRPSMRGPPASQRRGGGDEGRCEARRAVAATRWWGGRERVEWVGGQWGR